VAVVNPGLHARGLTAIGGTADKEVTAVGAAIGFNRQRVGRVAPNPRLEKFGEEHDNLSLNIEIDWI